MLNQKLLSKMESGIDYVVDGLRHPIDFETLSARPPFYLLYINASPQIRWQRLSSRDKSKTREEFSMLEMHPVESYTAGLRQRAHRVLANERGLSELKTALDAVFKEFTGSGSRRPS